MSMELVGGSVETGGDWDPANLASKASDETLAWYRAAELKHGRVSMLAAAGFIVQGLYQLPDPVFQNGKPLDALAQVCSPVLLLLCLVRVAASRTASFFFH
jgi:Chlorophyll A-B binding protein